MHRDSMHVGIGFLMLLPLVHGAAPFLGCFQASTFRDTVRDAATANVAAESCTNGDACIDACGANKYTLAALTRDGECLCTNVVPRHAVSCDGVDALALWDLATPPRSSYKNLRVHVFEPGAPVPQWASVVAEPQPTFWMRVFACAAGLAILYVLD